MMYQKKFASAIKVNGKVLREKNDTVALPYGSEYSILLKNLNSVKAQVKVSIDGKDATEGTWLVLQPNSSIDLERFIKSANSSSGNKFKFIERTASIENHRGIKTDDGLIRIEYKFETQYNYQIWNNLNTWPGQTIITNGGWSDCSQPQYNVQATMTSSGLDGAVGASSKCGSEPISVMNMSCSTGPIGSSRVMKSSSLCSAKSENEVGITVPGSKSNQKFTSTYNFACDSSEVMVIRLVGQVGETVIENPVTVDVRPRCESCGRVNKAKNKFCSECGTALVSY